MHTQESVYEKTYKNYLEQLREVSFESIAHNLGTKIEGNRIKIFLFKNQYEVSPQGIADPSGKKPTYDICVILSKYILLCPDTLPEINDWVSFKDFKDSGPLIPESCTN